MIDPMQYKKARGMKLLEKYLPQSAPFSNLRIIASYDDWNEVKGEYGSFACQRIDLPVGNSNGIVSNTNGSTSDIHRVLYEAKAQDPEAVLIVMNTKQPTCCRYLYNGSFNVFFKVGDFVIIELNGKGFDAHELNKGLAVHERYIITWKDMSLVDGTSKSLARASIDKYYVSPCQYARQRIQRVNFLVQDCRYRLNDVEENVPAQATRLDDALIENLYDNIVMPILNQKERLISDSYREFCIQGNFVYGKVQPWEMVTYKRWI